MKPAVVVPLIRIYKNEDGQSETAVCFVDCSTLLQERGGAGKSLMAMMMLMFMMTPPLNAPYKVLGRVYSLPG